jgi:hypothetical protein
MERGAIMGKVMEMDYVYNVDELEFRKVTIEIDVEESGMILKLHPEYMFTVPDLENMLTGFQNDVLEHKHIKLATECKVVIYHGGQTYNAAIGEGTPLVKEIIPA